MATMDGFYNKKSPKNTGVPKLSAGALPSSPVGIPRLQKTDSVGVTQLPKVDDDMAWLGSTEDCVRVVKDGKEACEPKRLEPMELYGSDWLRVGTIRAFEHYYFTAGNEIRVAMTGVGGGVVRMSHQVHSRTVQDDGRIYGIATTRDALKNQHFEPQAQVILPIPIGMGDFKGDGRTDIKFSSQGAPVRYKHDDENAKIVAWEIHTEAFRTDSDVGANYLSLIVLIKTVDLPKYKIYADGWGVGDVIFYEPSWFEKMWDKIVR